MRRQWMVWGLALLGIRQGLGAQSRAADGGTGGVSEVQRALGGEWTVSGEELRASGARSLAEALAGRVPGLHVLIAPGALGSLGAVQLRAPVSLQAQGAPLVVIDGVPADMGMVPSPAIFRTSRWWKVLGEIPLADLQQVSVARGLAASIAHGPRAYNGVILVTTGRAARRGVHGEFRQRIGMASRASSVESRRFTLEDARTNGVALYTVSTTPEQREASWKSCGGYCDLQDALFGGQRPEVATDAFGSWEHPQVQATASMGFRRTAAAARGTTDQGVGLRAALERSLWSGGNIRLAQQWSLLTGERPLDAMGNALLAVPIQYRPSWLNLRGIPGATRDSMYQNPLWSLDELHAPRRLSEHLTTLSIDLPLRSTPAHALVLTVLGGLHRVAQRDSANGAWLAGATADRAGDVRERWFRAGLRHVGTVRGASVTTAVGYELGVARMMAASSLSRGTAGGSESTSQEVATDAVVFGSSLVSGDGRTAASVTVRREAWRRALADVSPLIAWSAIATRRLGARGGPVVRLAYAAGAWRPSLQAVNVALVQGWDVESRREMEVGVSGTAGRDRVRWSLTGFTSPANTFLPLPRPIPIGIPEFAGVPTKVEARGIEATVAWDVVRAAARRWTSEVLLAHARSRYRGSPLGQQGMGLGLARATNAGLSVTGFVAGAGDPSSPDVRGDAWPAVLWSQLNTVRVGPWDLVTRLDGNLGVALPNRELAVSDEGGWTVDTGAAARRMAGLQARRADYLKGASWARLRQVTLSRALGGGRGSRAEALRVAITINNVFTLSAWRGLDPTVRTPYVPSMPDFSAWATYPAMRSISVEILRPF